MSIGGDIIKKLGKLKITSFDEPMNPLCTVEAQYNPKELQIDQNVPWKKPEAATQQGSAKASASMADEPVTLEFVGAEGRTITLELLFDGYENGEMGAAEVAKNVAALGALANVRQKGSTDEKMRRPHQCIVVWGTTLPAFMCVIESFQTKYTMFSEAGAALRATCTVKLKEAAAVDRKAPSGGGAPSGGTGAAR